VIYVLVNHLWPEHLTGGYVGVDVFFVISGYLITSHLLRERDRRGGVALGAFWARRARRLLPAALLVLLVSGALAAAFIPEWARQDDLAQIGWASLYVLNWALANESLDYFAQEAGQTLVVHYWSLSVEEQFYLVWPLVLVAAFALTRRAAERTRKVALITIFAGIGVASFGYALWAASAHPDAAYFQTTARAWEFAAGGLLALAPEIAPDRRLRLLPLLWLGWAGLAASAFVLDPASGVPGPAALLPVLATVVIIAIGRIDHPWSPEDVTGWRPVQWVGDISYSAYLWHFPLIVIAPYLLGHGLYAREKVALLAGTLILAALTKRFVEDPVRFGTLSRVRPRVVLAGALASMLLVGGGLVGTVTLHRVQSEAVAAELIAQAQAAGNECFGAQAALSGSPCPGSHLLVDPAYLDATPEDTLAEEDVALGRLSCVNEKHGTGVVRVCQDPPADEDPTLEVAMIGDSHMAVWRDAIRASAHPLGIRFRTYLKPGCPPSLNLEIYARQGADKTECRAWRTPAITDVATDPDIDVVVTTSLASSYRFVDGTPDDGRGYVDAWRMWLDAGKTVIVMNDTPRLEKPIADCILEEGVTTLDPCSRPRSEAVRETALELAAAQIQHERFYFVDYTDVLCDDRCHAVVGGIPAYKDSNHLSLAFTRSFGDELLRSEWHEIIGR
jgi:peptidoglycan/LPS O-acetylase OafA/YrhL